MHIYDLYDLLTYFDEELHIYTSNNEWLSHTIFKTKHHPSLVQTGMRSYFNGGGTPSSSSATPPPSLSSGGGAARRSSSYVPGGVRSSSASLPRSPDNDYQPSVAMSVHSSGGGGGQDVYMNIYQNTNHPSLFVSVHILFTFNVVLYLCHNNYVHDEKYLGRQVGTKHRIFVTSSGETTFCGYLDSRSLPKLGIKDCPNFPAILGLIFYAKIRCLVGRVFGNE